MPSGSRVALGVVGIGMGGLVIVGSLAGTLAAALAGLFDPSILAPATAGSGGIAVIPGNPGSRPGPAPGPGEEPPSQPSLLPVEPPAALPPGGGLPALPSGGTPPPALGGGGFGDFPALPEGIP